MADSHLALPVDRRALADLGEDLQPYRWLIDNGLPAVMVAHVLFPAVDALPASFSARWVGGVLRGELGFTGAVFADDLSMAGAASVGDIVARAGLALSAGCDVLPVCNDRASVVRLLDGLRLAPGPAGHLRLARMRGRPHAGREELLASAAWQEARDEVLALASAPRLDFEGAG